MRFLVGGRLLKVTHRAYRAGVHPFLSQKAGNVAMSFALLAIPLCLAIGASVDYVRAYNTQSRMQSDLDAALIAAIKEVDSLDDDEIKAEIVEWFNAQADTNDASYAVADSAITVSKVDRTVKAVVRGTIKTTFMGLANIKTIDVAAASSVAGPATSFMNVYIVMDKSPSMLLAATSSGQTSMRSMINCEFACHDTGDPVSYLGTNYSTYYAFAKAKNIKLRSDVAIDAVEEVLDMVDEANSSQTHVKVALYKLGTTVTEVLQPTASTNNARNKLTTTSSGLTSATSEAGTYFDKSLTALRTFVGTAGDGSSAAKPLKLVLLLTDGVQSERNFVLWWMKPNYDVLGWNASQSDSTKQEIWKTITPLNPKWCSNIKNDGVTIGVLYTKYLPIANDWGYSETVGKSMASSKFSSVWGGTIRSGVSSSTTRQAYIPYALEDCATSSDMFLSASDPDEIEEGLSTLFEQYLGSVRLTQ
jgi:Flp pilus assembly protein TadG